jgi:hypothetical protein
MLLAHLILLAISVAIEAGPPRAGALDLDRAHAARAGSSTPGAAWPDVPSHRGILSRSDQLSPWDDEIEFPDDSEDEEPEDPGEALNSRNPARDHSKAGSTSGPIEPAARGSGLAIVPSPHSAGSSRSPAALCRLLF